MKLNTFSWLRAESVGGIHDTKAQNFWVQKMTEDRLLPSEM